MQHKTIALWLAGVLAVLVVAAAGAWSLAVATAYAYADEPAKAEVAQPAVDAKAADTAAATEHTKTQPADEAPGVFQLPLRAKASRAADPAAIAPAAFSISGKKYLVGRDLQAGEFTFHIAKLGAYTIPLGSKLSSQLRSTALSAAEKYDLVTSGLTYYPSSVQPLPDPDTATNAADGTVAFAPITINGSMLGERATQRTTGVIFAYTFSEEPPRNADGTLVPGVTKDSLGRYVYEGVTYDDTLKRAYLYAYQDYDAEKKPVVKVIPLGDATFDGVPVRDQAGLGVGFRNTYNGAVVDDYDGAVYLEGQPIAAGEFNFAVHEVTEDGALVENEMVACEESKGGRDGAEVPVLNGQQMNQAGRFFFTVSQTAAGASAPANVELDKTSYVVTVDVAADAQDKLSASVTAVRKMAEGSDMWVDVNLSDDASTTPLVWENKLVADEPPAADDSATTDRPSAPDTPDASGTTPDAGAAAPNAPAAPDAGTDAPAAPDAGANAPATGANAPATGTTAPDASAEPDGDAAAPDASDADSDASSTPAPDNGNEAEEAAGTGIDGSASGAGSAAVAQPDADAAGAADHTSGNETSDAVHESEGDSAGKAVPAPDKTQAEQEDASQQGSPLVKFLAQTDDSSAWLPAVLAILMCGSVGALTLAYRRRG